MGMMVRKKWELTKENLLEIFTYNRRQGKIFWRRPTGNRAQRGSEAGNLVRMHGGMQYRQVSVQGVNLLVHHVIWFIEKKYWPKNRQLDHIDGDGTNNRIKNLRDVPTSEQSKNKPRRETNYSGVTGVSWNRNLRAWVAQIGSDKKPIYVGMFRDPAFERAVKARKEAEKTYGFHPNHGREKK